MRLLLALLLVLTFTPAAQAAPPARCDFIPTPENPAARPVRPPSALAPGSGSVRVWIFTNYGTVVAVFDRANAPCGVHNFAHLAQLLLHAHAVLPADELRAPGRTAVR